MKRKIYLSFLLLGGALTGYSQGSEIYSTTQTSAGGYYGAYGQLTFNTGYIVTPRATPATSSTYFTSGATYTGASDASHIDGYAEKEGTTAFVFPVGNGTKLRTAGISAPAASARFQAAYWFSNPDAATLPAGAPFPVANLGTGISAVSNVEYWDINGPSAVDLTLSWDAASGLDALTSSTLANLIVAGYNTATSKWEKVGTVSGTTGTLAATGTITVTGVTPDSYASYTFGNASIIDVLVNARIILQGNYNTAAGLMTTTLNSSNLLPLVPPYTNAPFNHPATATEVVAAGFFAAHPNIVDWVLVELRDPAAPATRLAHRAAFLTSNGTIVDMDGVSEVNMGTPTGTSFLVSIRHRNHLAVRTLTAITPATLDNAITIDFTTTTNLYVNAAYTNTPMATLGGIRVLWAGDANSNGVVRYSGPANDETVLFNTILVGNTSTVLSAQYNAADFNLNGIIRYSGPGNDETILFNTVLGGNSSLVMNQHL